MPGDMVMVAPPVSAIDFSAIGPLPGLKLVVAGSRDEYAAAEAIRELLPQWNAQAQLAVVEGADHFFGGYANELAQILAAHLLASSCDTGADRAL